MNVLDHSKLHQKYFEEISAIPRASFKEEKCADYLEQFAKEHGLDYVRDEMNNVVIYKPASAGYEDHETVILQAHTDMVCEKNADCDHDFDTEPLDLYIEDGWLRAKGTTLGTLSYGPSASGSGVCIYCSGRSWIVRRICTEKRVFQGNTLCEPGFRRRRQGNRYHQCRR